MSYLGRQFANRKVILHINENLRRPGVNSIFTRRNLGAFFIFLKLLLFNHIQLDIVRNEYFMT